MPARQHFDVIVLGGGGVGSATLYTLAKRGAGVLGIDLFPPGHDRGSSHGQTRVIRQAYFEHPNYVPLAIAAYDLWHQLERAVGQVLFTQTGLLQAGPVDGEVVQGVLAAAAQHQLKIDRLSASDANLRYAPLTFEQDHQVLYEHSAGYLRVEECVKAHLSAAVAHGATFLHGQRVIDWSSNNRRVTVKTDVADFEAQHLILALGAGTRDLWKLQIPVTVLRKHQYWYQLDGADDRLRQIPIFLVETGGEVFYGFPQINDHGMKVARHTGGDVVIGNPLVDSVRINESQQSQDEALVSMFLQHLMPDSSFACQRRSVCWYTITADRHFRLGRHPEFDNVCLAAGLSGHGFKFTPVLAAALADLTLDGATKYPVGFLSPREHP